jgi:predicted ATP-grasp superfamily ATP-dependent carboligase
MWKGRYENAREPSNVIVHRMVPGTGHEVMRKFGVLLEHRMSIFCLMSSVRQEPYLYQ